MVCRALRIFVLLAVLLGSFTTGVRLAAAQGPISGSGPTGGGIASAPLSSAFTYQGRLERGGSPVNGTCSMAFKLMDNPAGTANQIGNTLNKSVSVANGLFTVELDFGEYTFTGDGRFLDITVNCGSGAETLTPRQTLFAVPYALGLRPPTTLHYGGATLNLIGCAQGLAASGPAVREAPTSTPAITDCSALVGWADGSSPTIRANNTGSGMGVATTVKNNSAIYAVNNSIYATVWAKNNGTGNGVSAEAGAGTALYAMNNSIYTTVYAKNNGSGMGVAAEVGAGMALYGKNTGTRPALRLQNDASGTVVEAIAWSGDIIRAWERLDANGTNYNLRFKVTRQGDVRADGTFASPASDLADLLSAATGLEPGDVLVIGADGRLTRSTSANATHVAGVFATKPAFLGGMTEDATASPLEALPAMTPASPAGLTPAPQVASGLQAAPDLQVVSVAPVAQAPSSKAVASVGPKADDDPLARAYREQGLVPLALAGVVPVKVSAENGAIRPGDLLTSASLPGHAMRAQSVDVAGIALHRPGTIIGKALGGLEAGTGTIKVLVSLQ